MQCLVLKRFPACVLERFAAFFAIGVICLMAVCWSFCEKSPSAACRLMHGRAKCRWKVCEAGCEAAVDPMSNESFYFNVVYVFVEACCRLLRYIKAPVGSVCQ